MKLTFTAALLAFVLPVLADPAVGRWVTVDDEDGSKKSVVEISVNDKGELQGTIVEILRAADKGKLCSECPDNFKDQPIEGLTFMWGLKNDGEGEWESGRILDPKSGKVYKSQAKVSDDGQQLVVRGYIGVSWVGRSQTWLKYEEPAAVASEAPAEAAPEVATEALTAEGAAESK
ncbi:DUF2147 domain-containing protein [Thalassolituus sp. LLYu03]|uniref:DUF2147 domain-containing protein n=1 Tax=Thalassolituus sp. LLYu03 TaxID=3421656 RepID=UPI003D2AF44F